MAYEKLNLKDGTVLNEEHLAHIENGIEDAETVGADAVLYTAQTLTEEQQHQARLNIRCGSVGEVSSTNDASGKFSHAEGRSTIASGEFSHCEGDTTRASGSTSHAEGYGSRARGPYSHAEGFATDAGWLCHAEGAYTIARGMGQHVQGEYNVPEDIDYSVAKRGKYLHIVGNGTGETARSNAHTLDWDGVPWFAGDRVMLGGTGMDDEAAVVLMPVFVPQELTEEQKLQARTNIGAAAPGEGGGETAKDAVLYTEQALTEEQKAQARANIGVDAYIEQVFLGGEW